MKELYYTPCVADSSESDGNETETWGPGSHMNTDRKTKTPSKSKPIPEISDWFRSKLQRCLFKIISNCFIARKNINLMISFLDPIP